IEIMHATVAHSLDPYFRIYMCDLTMARLVRALILRKFKSKDVTVDQSEVVAIAEVMLNLLGSVVSDARNELTATGLPVRTDEDMPLVAIPPRANPGKFWSGAHFQAFKREQLMVELLEKLRAGKLLNLLPVPELLLVLAGGNANLGLKEFLDQKSV